MDYRIEVLRVDCPAWEPYAGYQTLAEALRQFHRLETHDGCANVRILLADGRQLCRAMKRYRTWEECETRYPRLVRAMCWVACLSRSEAACALRDWRNRDIYGDVPYGSEAVAHYGGPCRVLTDAIDRRHVVRRLLKSR